MHPKLNHASHDCVNDASNSIVTEAKVEAAEHDGHSVPPLSLQIIFNIIFFLHTFLFQKLDITY